MDRLESLVALNMVGDIGSVRLARLLDHFTTPQNIFQASPEELTYVSGVSENSALRIASFSAQDLHKEFLLAQKHDIKIISIDDEQYPDNLKTIHSAPIILYVKGSLQPEDTCSIALVGSRRASLQGLSHAKKIAAALAVKGLTVVSGMARGIDTSVHEGALCVKGRTIAVIGSGFTQIYPPENRNLAERIAQQGAVISEFPMSAPPLAHNFPRRNRIISGLSLGVVVVEAARNSGALITADYALEQGREVFALPGDINARNAFGTNELIKQGARLVSDAEEIIQELAVPLQARVHPVSIHQKPQAPENIALDERERLVYNLLSCDSLLFDEIIERLHISVAEASQLLLGMQLHNVIKQLTGKRFSAVAHGVP